MFLKFEPYRVWCSIFYSKLVNSILFKIIVQHVRFVKCRGTCGSGERNVKIWIDFRKYPRFSLTSPLSQEREKSSRPVFTMCGEPCIPVSTLQHICFILFRNSRSPSKSPSKRHPIPKRPSKSAGYETKHDQFRIYTFPHLFDNMIEIIDHLQ